MEYIYIAKNDLISNMVKIGRTKNPEKRLMELSSILPVPFTFIKVYEVENSSFVENFIHTCLSNIRVPNREFFSTKGINDIISTVDSIINDATFNYLKNRHKYIDRIDSAESFIKTVNALRIGKDVSYEALSNRAGLSTSTITRLFADKKNIGISLDNFMTILQVLNIEVYIGSDLKTKTEGIRRRRASKVYSVTQP